MADGEQILILAAEYADPRSLIMTNRMDQPRELDLVGSPILIAGIGRGFEGQLQYRITDGHDEVTGHFMVGGGTGESDLFQLQVDVSGAGFTRDRLFVEVFEPSAADDGGERNKVMASVIYAPLIIAGASYIGYREHHVESGDTLSGIAAVHYGDPSLYARIVRANPEQISDPNLIFPGQLLRIPIAY